MTKSDTIKENRKPNKLINEKSPYLLQHAHNPVNWNPWGEEAFVKAREEDKPIFLSVGYSTCHWCHVCIGNRINVPIENRIDRGLTVIIT